PRRRAGVAVGPAVPPRDRQPRRRADHHPARPDRAARGGARRPRRAGPPARADGRHAAHQRGRDARGKIARLCAPHPSARRHQAVRGVDPGRGPRLDLNSSRRPTRLRAMTCGPMRLAFVLLLAGCAGAIHPPPQAAATPAAPPERSLPGPAFADPQDRARKLAEALPEVEAVFEEQFTAGKAPGMTVALVVDGEVRWSRSWGVRDLAQAQPPDRDTLFRIASLTKSFTAIAVVRVRDAGKLPLDDQAEKYLPELARLRYPTRDSPRITVRQLLSHSAGCPEDNRWGDLQLDMSGDELQRMLSRGLSFSRAPGTGYEYSNTGFALLGALVQRVSGQRVEDYLTEHVLKPLGMSATVWRPQYVPAGRLALGYGHRLGARGSCDFERIVSRGGGLRGFGSVIALLPERGIAVVGASNSTYTAPDPWPALVLLAQKGAIPQRQLRPAPELSQAAQAVAALLEQWDPALAQARFDRTAWYYEPPDELKTELAELHAKLGPCRPGQLEPENALRGTQSLSCERGTLDAYLTLTPEVPPLIQHLEL